ncbi:S-layer homology domain-containing protein [Candidatus Agathobaculum pullicola]|uniref:S-layer homology domain-containing protein n=1 Tax=Candidatus Agathobaculum pullicola TaxID=2838426 RepID=UPI003F8FB365
MKKRLTALLLMLVLLIPCLPLAAAAAETPVAASTGTKLIAFTFDDGPSAYTATLLDGLKARGAKATFFMNGANGPHGIVSHGSLLTRMREEGHQLANHTYQHLIPFDSYGAATISSEVSRVESLLFDRMGGAYTDMVRTPGGALGGAVKSTVAAPIIQWSVDPLDWKYRNASTVYNNIIRGAHDGAIVLAHDIYQTSVQGALRAIDTLKAQGYEFVTVAELLRRRGITPQNGLVYTSAPNKGTNLPAYAAPTITSTPGDNGVSVTFSTADTGLTLYYTTSNATPHLGSTKYTAPITITRDTTFTVIGIDKYGTRTPVTTQTVAGIPPTTAPTVLYENGVLTLNCATAGASIYYTTDGSTPTASSTPYTGPFTPTTTTKCIAILSGHLNSPVVTCTLTQYGRLFTDVPADSWYYDSVGEIVQQGLMNGTDAYTFSPDTVMSRAMLTTVLYNLAGKPDVGDNLGYPYADVDANAYYALPVYWARANGLVTGYTDETFAPNDTVTREQAAVLLYRLANFLGKDTSARADLSVYTDAAQINAYAREAMQWAVASGLLNGRTATTLAPLGSATRAEGAKILTNFTALP